jgi:hypothetical protein
VSASTWSSSCRERSSVIGRYGLQTSPTGRWGERLSVGITQALATDLMARLPQNRVVWSDPGRQKSTRELLVDVEGRCVA